MKHPFPETPEPTSREKFRANLREQCLAGGMAVETVDETIDLAMHAADEAAATISRICDTSTNPAVSLQALPMALQLVSQQTADAAKEIMGLMKASGAFGSFDVAVRGA